MGTWTVQLGMYPVVKQGRYRQTQAQTSLVLSILSGPGAADAVPKQTFFY